RSEKMAARNGWRFANTATCEGPTRPIAPNHSRCDHERADHREGVGEPDRRTVKFRAQSVTVASSMKSAALSGRIVSTLPSRLLLMPEPTRDDVDALVGPATPHFAYQLRARVYELVKDLPEDHEVRRSRPRTSTGTGRSRP